MKSTVKNPSKKTSKKPAARKTATRGSSTRTAGGKYLHRPAVITNKPLLTKVKTAANTYKFNPSDKWIVSLLKNFTEPGTYTITVSKSDIIKINKYLKR